jgi:hypothetical protein
MPSAELLPAAVLKRKAVVYIRQSLLDGAGLLDLVDAEPRPNRRRRAPERELTVVRV